MTIKKPMNAINNLTRVTMQKNGANRSTAKSLIIL